MADDNQPEKIINIESSVNVGTANDSTRELLRQVFTTPEELRPIERQETNTKQAAESFAQIAGLLEKRGFAPSQIAPFFMKVLFALFAEDIKLLGTPSSGRFAWPAATWPCAASRRDSNLPEDRRRCMQRPQRHPARAIIERIAGRGAVLAPAIWAMIHRAIYAINAAVAGGTTPPLPATTPWLALVAARHRRCIARTVIPRESHCCATNP